MAMLKASVRFWALVSGSCLLLALGLIASGQWGNWANVAWLTPGARLVSWQFSCFLIVSVTFIVAGFTVGRDASKAMVACSTGFIMSFLGFTWFARAGATAENVATGLVFFIVPALVYAWAASRLGRSSSTRPWTPSNP